MKIAKKKNIIIVGIIALVGYIAWWISGHNYGVAQEHDLRDIKQCIVLYIQLNNGEFPKSEKDLIDKGFLKVIKIEGTKEIRYELLTNPLTSQGPCEEKGFWLNCPFFKIFPIKYGITLDQLDSHNKKLYSPLDNKPILLFEGPYRGLHSSYKEVSYSWYEEMKRMKFLSRIGVLK